MSKINLPISSVKYILFQRTEYLKDNKIFKLLSKIGSSPQFFKMSVNLKSILFGSKIIEQYSKDMESEFELIKQHLPQTAGSILDIGCGMACVDVFISKYYKNNIKIFLLDKTQVDNIVYYNYEQRGSFYNSLQLSKKILESNGVGADMIQTQEATEKNEILFKDNFDIVISLISWGFHYPLSTYLENVYNKLNKHGILIVDIRKNTGGEKEIEKLFGNCKIILDSEKYTKVLAVKF